MNTATITIAGTSGSAAIPVVTITPGGLRVPAGQPAVFTIAIDRPLTDPLDVSVSYGGNAVPGSDYNPAGGVLTIPPGMTSLAVQIPTLDNGKVQVDPALWISVLPSANYVVGDPTTAAVVIVSSTLPKINILGGPAAVGLGGGAQFTIVADQPPVKDISVQYTVTGTAQQGKDLQPVTGTVVLAAGQTTANVPILTLEHQRVLPPDRHDRGHVAHPPGAGVREGGRGRPRRHAAVQPDRDRSSRSRSTPPPPTARS